MSTIAIISDNPTTWNRPGWKDNSCYANASLWALLYNDAYKLFINDTKIKKEITDLKKEVTKEDGTKEEKILATVDVLNSNKKIVKDNLINFQNAIQNYSTRINSSVILDYTTAIRGALSKITGNNDLLRNFFSPDEFLGIIGTVFINNDKLSLDGNVDSMVFPIITLTPDYTIENTSDKNITTSYKNPDTSTSYVLEDQLIIDYPKLGLSSDVVVEGSFNELAGQHSEKFYSIGQYKLYAFVHWQGGSHYVCYFEFNNEWYQFDDYTNNHNGSIKKVLNLKDSEIYNESFLFFYKFDNTLSLNTNVTITEYLQTGGNALIITNNATKLEDSEQPQPPARQISQPGAPKSSSSSSNLTPEASKTFISSIQVANNCEKYGQDWLDLFIDENAVPGTLTVRRYQNNNIKSASFQNINTGELTTVNVDQNCTFVPEKTATPVVVEQSSSVLPTATAAQPAKQKEKFYVDPKNGDVIQTTDFRPGSGWYVNGVKIPVESLFITNDEAKQFSESTKKGLLQFEEFKKNYEKDMNIPPFAVKQIFRLNINKDLNVVQTKPNLNNIKDGEAYFVINDDVLYIVSDRKLYDVKNNTFYEKSGRGNQSTWKLKGGTRKRNKNTNGGKRTIKVNLRKGRKTRKGKKSRKLIRNKNKLKTNKLNTNKLNTNKLRTRKA
jgi:hypothetical protein